MIAATNVREEFMKVQLMSAVGTVSMVAVVAAIGCGGTTSALAGPDSGTPAPEGAAPSPEGSSTNPPPAMDGGASAFSPAGLGALLGGNVDGGGPSFGVTQQVATGCDALCAKEATANCP